MGKHTLLYVGLAVTVVVAVAYYYFGSSPKSLAHMPPLEAFEGSGATPVALPETDPFDDDFAPYDEPASEDRFPESGDDTLFGGVRPEDLLPPASHGASEYLSQNPRVPSMKPVFLDGRNNAGIDTRNVDGRLPNLQLRPEPVMKDTGFRPYWGMSGRMPADDAVEEEMY